MTLLLRCRLENEDAVDFGVSGLNGISASLAYNEHEVNRGEALGEFETYRELIRLRIADRLANFALPIFKLLIQGQGPIADVILQERGPIADVVLNDPTHVFPVKTGVSPAHDQF